MGKKGSTRHQKRLSAPIVYPIMRKHGTFTIRSHPPRFSKEYSIPLGVVVRDIFGYTNNYRETKKALQEGVIKIDGKIRKSVKFAVCPMDNIEITSTSEQFRVTPFSGRRKLTLHPISEDELTWKLLQVKGKKKIRGDKIVLSFHDGRSLIWDEENKSKDVNIDEILPGSSVKFDLNEKKVLEHYPFAVNSTVVILGGHSTGTSGNIQSIEKRYGRYKSIILIQTDTGNIRTSSENIFITGKGNSSIDIPVSKGVEAVEHVEE